VDPVLSALHISSHVRGTPPSQGHSTKMSASQEHTAIFMTDTANQIKSKVRPSPVLFCVAWCRLC